jgi:glycosyltransferase involved in cell wall biosynthesis
MQTVAPIKLGENLLCGTPVLTTTGIGDTAMVIDTEIRYLTQEMNDEELRRAATWFLETVIPNREGFRDRCREARICHFSLDTAVEDYFEALELGINRDSD